MKVLAKKHGSSKHGKDKCHSVFNRVIVQLGNGDSIFEFMVLLVEPVQREILVVEVEKTVAPVEEEVE